MSLNLSQVCHAYVPEISQLLIYTLDTSPLNFLFQAPSVPTLSSTIRSFVDTPFQKYQLTLKRQLLGRSAQLDDVLSALEHCARTIQQDFSIVKAGTRSDEKTKSVFFSWTLILFLKYETIGRLLTNSQKPINPLRILFQSTLYLSSTKQCQRPPTRKMVRCYYLPSTVVERSSSRINRQRTSVSE